MSHFADENALGKNNTLSFMNIQEPVREMMTSLSKTIRVQAQQIAKLEAQAKNHAAEDIKEQLAAMLEKALIHMKAELTPTTGGASMGQVTTLENALHESKQELSRMTEIVQHQSSAIKDLNQRLEKTTAEIKLLQHPNLDNVYAYIDRHVSTLDRQISSKVDQASLDAFSPRRTDESLRGLSYAVADMKMELDRKATREQFQALSDNKVDHQQYIDLLASMNEKISVTELTSSVNKQVKPLVMAVAALEKAVVIQTANSQISAVTGTEASRVSKIQPDTLQHHMDRKIGPAAVPNSSSVRLNSADVREVTEIVEVLLQSRIIGDVTQSSLDRVLSSHHDEVIGEASDMTRQLRGEIMSTISKEREKGNDRQKAVDERMGDLLKSLLLTQQQQQETTASVQELAASVLKAFKKKADKIQVEQLAVMLDESLDHQVAASVARVEASRVEFDSFYDASDRTPQPQRRSNSAAAASSAIGGGNPSVSVRTGVLSTRLQSPKPHAKSPYTPHKSQALNAIRSLEGVQAEAEELRKSLLEIKGRAEKAEVEAAALKVSLAEKEILLQKEREKDKEQEWELEKKASMARSSSNVVNTEWRLALGELSTALRRELGEKMARSDFQGMLSPDIVRLDVAVQQLQKEVARKCENEDLGKFHHDLKALQGRVISELTGGMWLWTSRQLIGEESTVPWDTQVLNAAPASLLWRKGSGLITVRLPGLYRISIAIFTSLPVKITVCLNDEPLLVLQPEPIGGTADFSMAGYLGAAMHRDESYSLRRLRHSAGDVTAATLDEPLNLPADGVLSVRFNCNVRAQGMLCLRKL